MRTTCLFRKHVPVVAETNIEFRTDVPITWLASLALFYQKLHDFASLIIMTLTTMKYQLYILYILYEVIECFRSVKSTF